MYRVNRSISLPLWREIYGVHLSVGVRKVKAPESRSDHAVPPPTARASSLH